MSEKRSYWVSRISFLLGFLFGWAGYLLVWFYGAWGFDGPGASCLPSWIVDLSFKGFFLMLLGIALIILGIVFSDRRTLLVTVSTGLASLAITILAGSYMIPMLGRKALSEC